MLELSAKERNTIAHSHIEVLNEQAIVYQTYMRDRVFTGDFPEKEESLYVINVVESIYEETMELNRAVAAPSGYDDVYEYIVMKKLRFGKASAYYKVQVFPIIYHPAPGDIVTLPAHILVQAALLDNRLTIPTNWEMEVVDVTIDPSYSHEWKGSSSKSPLLPDNVKISAPVLTVKPRNSDKPFEFPKIPMNHYILLHPTKEENDHDVNRA